MHTLDMTPDERKEYRKKIQRIAEKCVWYTSTTWERFRIEKKRTSFHELNRKDNPVVVGLLILGFVGFLIWWLIKFENNLEVKTNLIKNLGHGINEEGLEIGQNFLVKYLLKC